MPFGSKPTSHFDGTFLGQALKSLLKTKGAKEIPQEMNVEVLQPTVDVAQHGFALYEKKGLSSNTALVGGNSQQVISLASAGATSGIDTADKETLILGLNWQYVQNANRANDNLGYILQLLFNDVPLQPSAKLARSFYKYTTTGTDTAYDFGIYGEFEDGTAPPNNPSVPPQLGNRLWIPANAELQLIIYNTATFQAGDIVFHNIIGVQVPKNTPVPQF